MSETRRAGSSVGAVRLTAAERDALLAAWPWPSEAATTVDGFGDVVAAVEWLVAQRFEEVRTLHSRTHVVTSYEHFVVATEVCAECMKPTPCPTERAAS